MKAFLSAVVLLFAFLLCAESTFACTCVIDSLSKRFRKADAVFVGRLTDYEGEPTSNIQNFKPGLWVLEVKRSFKGIKQDFVAIDLDMEDFSGACPSLTRLDDDVDYLVFAYGKGLKIHAECPDTRPIKPEYNLTIREISRLENFWFRTKARLWPF